MELTNEEAELFKKFRQYQEEFEALIKSDVFSIRGGQAIMIFDDKGVFRRVRIIRDPWVLGKKKLF